MFLLPDAAAPVAGAAPSASLGDGALKRDRSVDMLPKAGAGAIGASETGGGSASRGTGSTTVVVFDRGAVAF